MYAAGHSPCRVAIFVHFALERNKMGPWETRVLYITFPEKTPLKECVDKVFFGTLPTLSFLYGFFLSITHTRMYSPNHFEQYWNFSEVKISTDWVYIKKI